MKATLVAAALLGGASAHVHRRGHELFHRRSNDTEVCLPGCTTSYTTITGDFICMPPDFLPDLAICPGRALTDTTDPGQPTPNAPAKAASTTRATSAPVTKVASAVPSSVVSTPAVVPTPQAQSCPTPGESPASRYQGT